MFSRQKRVLAIILFVASPGMTRGATYVNSFVDSDSHVHSGVGPFADDSPSQKPGVFGGAATSITSSASLPAFSASASGGSSLTVGPTGISVSANGSWSRGTLGSTAHIGAEGSGRFIFWTDVAEPITLNLPTSGQNWQITVSGPMIAPFGGLYSPGFYPGPTVTNTYLPGYHTIDWLAYAFSTTSPSGVAGMSFSMPMTMTAPEPSSLMLVTCGLFTLYRRSRKTRAWKKSAPAQDFR